MKVTSSYVSTPGFKMKHLKFLHQSSFASSTYIPISKYQLPASQHLVTNQVLVNRNHDCLPEMTGNLSVQFACDPISRNELSRIWSGFE
jgi:hypothetical protein